MNVEIPAAGTTWLSGPSYVTFPPNWCRFKLKDLGYGFRFCVEAHYNQRKHERSVQWIGVSVKLLIWPKAARPLSFPFRTFRYRLRRIPHPPQPFQTREKTSLLAFVLEVVPRQCPGTKRQSRSLSGRFWEGASTLTLAWRTTVQERGVTFMGDLRANWWRYAAPVLGIAVYLGLEALGADLWIAIVIPVLLAAGLGFIAGRRQ
jgi:hypothetical protein